jgi:hypothetical protein
MSTSSTYYGWFSIISGRYCFSSLLFVHLVFLAPIAFSRWLGAPLWLGSVRSRKCLETLQPLANAVDIQRERALEKENTQQSHGTPV